MKLNIGELVNLYRRKSPGIGLVVDKIDHIIENEFVEIQLQTLITDWNHGKDFKSKNYAISRFIEKSGLEENLVMAFLTSNGFYRYGRLTPQKNLKEINKSFVKVFWMMVPSNYNIKPIIRNIDLYPTEWLKVLKKPKKLLDK